MAELRMVSLEAQPIARDAWAPFGWLPRADTDPDDGRDTLHYEWGDAHLNVIAHLPGEVEHTAEGLVCAGVYRHVTHTQALMAMNCDAVLVVAPAGHDFSDGTGVVAGRAFHVVPQQVLVLGQGTWHWGPYPLGTEPVELLNVQGRRYAEDNEYADFAALTGAVIEVVRPA